MFHGPGDLRVEEVPRPEAGPGEVLVQIEVARTDGTDATNASCGSAIRTSAIALRAGTGSLPSPA